MTKWLFPLLFGLLAVSEPALAQRRNARAAEAAAANASDVVAGQNRTAFLAQAICPGLESRVSIPGLETQAQRQAVIANRWAYAQTRLGNFQRVESELRAVLAAQTNTSSRAQQELVALEADAEAAYARAGAQLVDWWLAQSVEMREINPQFPPGSGSVHPLTPFLQTGQSLRNYLSPFDGRAAFATYLRPVADKFDRCLGEMQDQIVNSNTTEIRGLLPRLNASADFRALEQRYAVAPGGFDARGPENLPVVIAELRTAMAVVVKREEEEAERQRIMADATARAEYERQQRAAAAANAVREAELRRMRGVAQRFIAAARTGDVAAMGATMHSDVVVSAPRRPPQYGKNAVIAAMRQGMSNGGAPPTFGDAQISADGVYAPMRAQNYQLTMRFQFAAGLIRQIQIVQ